MKAYSHFQKDIPTLKGLFKTTILPIVLFMHLDCCGASCKVFEILAIEMSVFAPIR